MKAKKPAKPARPAPVTPIAGSVDAIIRLMEAAKRQGIAHLKGPDGLEFTFRRESLKPGGISGVKESDQDWIP